MTTRRIARRGTGSAPATMPVVQVVANGDNIAECPADANLLSEILNATPRVARGLRKDGYLHVSDLLHRCMRKFALSDKFFTPVRPVRLSASDRIVFAIGDAIHDTAKAMATEARPDRVWGLWRCKCGHLYHDTPCLQSEVDQEDSCELCHTTTSTYLEVPMFNEEYNIVGNPDLILYLREVDAYHITELKSIAHDAWKDIARPQPDHVLQVLFYWFLMHELGYRLTDRVSVTYITKGYQFGNKQWEKEFMLDPLAELHRLAPYLTDALALKLSRTSDLLPTRKTCSGEYTTQAKKCEVCQLCFSLPSLT